MPALSLIYDKLLDGETFGKIEQHRLGGSYFWGTLWISKGLSGNFICWRNYGSSANEVSIENLDWIIKQIFRTTPEKFLFEYTTYSEWKRIDEYYKSYKN